MHRSLRRPLMLAWVSLTLLMSLLPPWDLCLHQDGALCDEVRRSSCCGNEPEPTSDGGPCNDCFDVLATPSLQADSRPIPRLSFVSLATPALLTVDPSLSRLRQNLLSGETLSIDTGPPLPALSLPLLC